MPPRWLCLSIVAFWLATTGWLVWCEVRDEIGSDDPPPYVIDIADEAQPENNRIRWQVWQGEEPPALTFSPAVASAAAQGLAQPMLNSPGAYYLQLAIYLETVTVVHPMTNFFARTWIEHRSRPDDFTFVVEFLPKQTNARRMDLGPIKLKSMDSRYRVDRAGRLLHAEASFYFDHDLLGEDISFRLVGDVQAGEFRGSYAFLSALINHESTLDPVPVSRRGSVLLPMHPVNRIRGLIPGRHWRMPIVDPLGDALGSSMGAGRSGPRMLSAQVLPGLHWLDRLPTPGIASSAGEKPIHCLIIEYDTGVKDAVRPRTWVRAADGLVVRQEADVNGQRLVMQRDVIPELPTE
jgi:hypothetical protein